MQDANFLFKIPLILELARVYELQTKNTVFSLETP